MTRDPSRLFLKPGAALHMRELFASCTKPQAT